MNTIDRRGKSAISLMLMLSLMFSILVVPTPAEAGFLSSFWRGVAPVLQIGGRIGGAIIGATMASAVAPPLGTLVGGIAGWIAGGVITDYATSSLMNLAILAGGIAGAMALGPSLAGIVGGFLIGGILSKVAMTLLHQIDRTATGGLLFSKAGAPLPQTGVSTANDLGAVRSEFSNTAERAASAVKKAGNTVSSASKKAADTLVREAQEQYERASQAYTNAVQKAERPEIIRQAGKTLEQARQNLMKLLRKP